MKDCVIYLRHLRELIVSGKIDPCAHVYGQEHPKREAAIEKHIQALEQAIKRIEKSEERPTAAEMLMDALEKAKERYDKAVCMPGNEVNVRRALHGITGIAQQLNEAKKLELKERQSAMGSKE